MPIHPMFQIANVSPSPVDTPIYEIQVRYSRAPLWKYKDRGYTSVAEAEADIPLLQAQGVLPSDDALNKDAAGG